MTMKLKFTDMLLAIISVIFIFSPISIEVSAVDYDNDTELKFTWTAASGNVDHYNVYVSTDGGEYALTGTTSETSYIVTGSDGLTYKIKVEAVDAAGNVGPMSEESDSVTVSLTASYANITVLLEGPYESAKTMRTGLTIPTLSPYADARTVATVPANAVDWVYVEIRSDKTTTVRGESMFLLSDGSIVDGKDETRANFHNLPPGNYYLVIHHRNHLPIMSKFPVPLVESGSSSVVLTVKDNVYTVGEANAMKELETGIYGMYAGDASPNGRITIGDFDVWSNSFITRDSGYKASDLNLNGLVTISDFDIWSNNFLSRPSSQVPDAPSMPATITPTTNVSIADEVEFRTVVTKNDNFVGGDFHLDLEIRIKSGTSPRTLSSFQADISYGPELTNPTATNWASDLSADGYNLTYTQDYGTYYSVVVVGGTNVIQGQGWNVTNEPDNPNDWQKVVTVKWNIAKATSVNILINDNTNEASYFNNLHNDPSGGGTTPWNVSRVPLKWETGEFDIKLIAGAERNLISLPLTPSKPYTSYSLIKDISNCTEIIRFNANTQKWESTSYSNGKISGPDFPIVEGEGYSVKVLSDTVYTFTGDVITTPITLNLKRGDNLIGIPYSAEPYTSHTLISAIPNCTRIMRYNMNTLSWEVTSYKRQGGVSGPNFEIKAGEGYYVHVTINTSWVPDSSVAPMIVPAQTKLSQNYPNPFNPETWIPFQLAKDSEVNIRIYNVTGQLIKTIELGYRQAGMYIEKSNAAHWNGRNNLGEKAASGVYFYELQTETFRTIRKMFLLK